ncbi:LysR family transcriptional regulator [Actinophytocola xinjiangensis]|uniref:LysR family transcriptional regulator n=1 Tax=Actinophytocola xinjiangensis TaxID=485602 RepID=A0A7Z0WR28_9PSEU|nr:LysR family transcriptional regulator [Actinophytocola xinjiangensis]OLF13801.1 LysR family transcriptional regulator [Actinophytocola xinjiangensis]
MELELRHLRVVCAVAESGSITKAAARLGLAQPALTTQLGRIERALGGPLFQRDRRGTRPTPLGELVLARAKVLLPAVEDLRDEAVRLSGIDPATLRCRIGSTGNSMVSGLVRLLSEDQPEATVIPHTSWSAQELVDKVAEGRLDFAVIGICGDMQPPAEHGLEWRLIAVDAVGVLLCDDHPLAGGAEVDLADLADSRWVAAPGEGCFGECFATACARVGFTPKPMYETDLRVCIDLVEGGQAVALAQPTFRELSDMRAYPLAGAPLRWRHLLGWHPEAPAQAVAAKVHQYAMAAYTDSLRHSPNYARWLAAHPRFGAQEHSPA